MDGAGIAALFTSILANIAMLIRVLYSERSKAARAKAEVDAASVKTETAEAEAAAEADERTSKAWQRYAARLEKRVANVEAGNAELTTRDIKCQVKVAQLEEQNRNQGNAIVEQARNIVKLNGELEALKRHLSACGTRSDSAEIPIPEREGESSGVSKQPQQG